MAPAHTLVAQACLLGILLHLDEYVTTISLKQYPLATKYAAKHWVDHARFQGVTVSRDVEEVIKQAV